MKFIKDEFHSYLTYLLAMTIISIILIHNYMEEELFRYEKRIHFYLWGELVLRGDALLKRCTKMKSGIC